MTQALSHAEVVFDKFHVLQHASAALDEVRRREFFRAGTVMREHGRRSTQFDRLETWPLSQRSNGVLKSAKTEKRPPRVETASILNRVGLVV